MMQLPERCPLDHLPLCGRPDDVALVLKNTTLTFAEMNHEVGVLAARLRHFGQLRGWAPGTRIASWAAKGMATCLLPLAAPRAGFVHVPINLVLKRAQVAHILRDSGARLLIANAGRLNSLLDGDVPDACATWHEEQAFVAAADNPTFDPLPPSTAGGDELAAILYTSGSTGLPKGVMLSHDNLWLGAAAVAQFLQLDHQDRTLCVLPLAFDYGQNQLFSAWFAGGTAVPVDHLIPRDVVTAVAKHGITTLAGVPPLWTELVDQEWTQEAIRPLLRLTNSGGALSENLIKRLRAKFPDARLFAMYGLTEAFRSTFLDPALIDEKPGSIGRPIPFAEIYVVKDDGQLAREGEEGELVHAGPLVAQGYWRDEEATAQRFRSAPTGAGVANKAVWSGDSVRIGDDGLMYFVGRRDAMIKSYGQRISPQEIEDAAQATGLVRECAAFGVADAAAGQTVHLVASAARTECADKAQAELPAMLARILPRYMQPRQIHWRDHLPRGATGKLDRATMKAELESWHSAHRSGST
ncbi:AMP-binding protein [Croceicoccus sp. F390]|uniref:AMP-binding protein n=1 Tax=Croceicoccus esteveae TaxID=3075597 RepID=A0ABU2ZLI9_9SPHN|nr:AMP-binding protein [Croceicoccus sp. F390]MDT0576903.1 AMP-binding protein [Croceicoccus sp. F390]